MYPLADALDLLSTTTTSLHKYLWSLPCGEERAQLEEEGVPRPMSELWEKRESNATSLVKEWSSHYNTVGAMSEFFRLASESTVDTIVHVVLARVQYDEESFYPEMCKTSKNANSCYHGHIGVVFEPLYVTPSRPREVVSMGFYPNEGNVHNLQPGRVSDGSLQMPDVMIEDWRAQLAQGRKDASVEDHLSILQTFVYSPENMAKWYHLLKVRVGEIRGTEDDVDDEGVRFDGKFGFYSGTPLDKIEYEVAKQLRESMDWLWGSMEILARELPAVNDYATPYNCATWMLAAFPEANMVCPLGVPRLCARRGEYSKSFKQYFKSLEEGLKLMVEEATSLVAEVQKKKQELRRALPQPPELQSRPPTSLATWSTWARV
tara:strand:- start:479 stop:1606 length:1128 start_codon:yes stop_codon:yes gene_type:complete